jgi:predicted dehydrogenase
MRDIKNIAIIGAGQLGSRHLQALAKIAIPAELEVVDPSPESLKIAEERFKEIPSNPKVTNIRYANSINDLHSDIDFCIVATNSDVRAQVTEELLSKKAVQYLILEKVLFQTEGDYEIIGKLIETHKVKTWVNCTRRMWPVYKEIRDNLMDCRLLEINISGSNWGLASNSIHMIDLIAYLTGISEYDIRGDLIDSDVVENKRKGFIEVTGRLEGSFKNGPNFSISSYKHGRVPSVIQLMSKKSIYFISEYSRK